MAFEPHFFPYHPRRIRIAMFCGAIAALVLGAAALAQARAAPSLVGTTRAAICFGLMLAFLVPFFRLKPREGWGIELTEREVKVARPFTGQPIVLGWEDIAYARRSGKAKRTLLLMLDPPPQRVVVARQLFPSARDFEALCEALENVKPPPRLDA